MAFAPGSELWRIALPGLAMTESSSGPGVVRFYSAAAGAKKVLSIAELSVLVLLVQYDYHTVFWLAGGMALFD